MPACPSCGAENPERAKFCLECGSPLTDVAPAPMREERKVVSVLFCDLAGFTAASEISDPEDVQRRLDPYHARVRTEIERFGGSVEKYIGDAVMAVFGIPAAHEDDAERAVRTGLAVLEAIEELNAADPGLELRVRIGVNTGEALVSLSARPETGQWMVSGDVTNTASRLQTVAPEGSVVVGEVTYRQTRAIFEYEPLEPVEVKGKREPLALWRAKAARARFGTDITRAHTAPFVGRELEKPLLIGAFERAAQTETAQLVTIVGEPGVGKSRLVAELLAYVDAKPELVTWRQGRCLPYGDRITFWALGEIVKAHAGIYETDAPETATAKLEAVLPEGEDRAWLRARLLPLLGIDPGADASQEESFAAWRRFLEDIAAGGPAVIVVEDLHWADPALFDFVTHLAEWAEGVPLLVLCTARPELYEQRPGWAGGMRNATTINLAPLSAAETAELVSSLLAEAVTKDVEQAIRERSGGNPLYAEEFVRLLADRGLDAGEGGEAFPDSVQALIAARLDTLPPDRKALLQDAAVLGKVFWAGALAEIGGRDRDELERALHELSRKELVRPARTSSLEGESEYAFWHLLVRDVAYAQIPRGDRGRRHRAAAGWIKRAAGERVEDLADVLAHHYVQALELARAAGSDREADELVLPARRFLALAGERALGLDAAQGEAKLARALELCAAEDPDRPELLVKWAEAALGLGRLREAMDAVEEALAALRRNGEHRATARALMLRATIGAYLGSGDLRANAAEAVSLLERLGPGAALVDAYAQLARAHFFAGSLDEALAACGRALDLAEQLRLPPPARALATRGNVRADLGQREGIVEMERAAELFLQQGASRDAGAVQANVALARLAFEGPQATLAAFEQIGESLRRRGLAEYMSDNNTVLLLFELGRSEEALDKARSLPWQESLFDSEPRAVAVAVLAERGEPHALDVDQVLRSELEGEVMDAVIVGSWAAALAHAPDDPQRALAILRRLADAEGARGSPYFARTLAAAVRTALAAGDAELAGRLAEGVEPIDPLHEHALCAARAQLAEAAGDHEGAAALFAETAERWREFGHVPERAYALLGQGRCLVALGRPGAEAPLAEAQELFESMGYRPALAATEALLAQATIDQEPANPSAVRD